MKFMRNEEGFTGLEAAIVLIAFVVVAAVFSYVMLGAGFFTSQKSQEVVHTSVQQASSSVEVVGNVIGKGDATGTKLVHVIFTIGTTAGGSAFDLNDMVITYMDEDKKTTITPDATSITVAGINVVDPPGAAGEWSVIKYLNSQDGAMAGGLEGDVLVEPGEQVVIDCYLSDDVTLSANKQFMIDLVPTAGANLEISKTAPPQIDLVNILY